MTVTAHYLHDVSIEAYGSLYLVYARSTEARDWITANTGDDAIWYCGALVVEGEHFGPLFDALCDEGMRIR
jgi:hypothetical protein